MSLLSAIMNGVTVKPSDLENAGVFGGIIPATALGADPTGQKDSTDQIVAAAALGVLGVLPGQMFKVSGDLYIPKILNLGGQIEGSGALTFDSVWNPSIPVFRGAGSFRPLDNSFSVGWYVGNTFNAKWGIMARAFVTGVVKELDIPPVLAGDPAASLSQSGVGTAWKQTAPIYMNDPENFLTIRQRASIYAAAAMDGMFIYGKLATGTGQKPENIIWHNQRLDCGNNATSGEVIHGGARILHHGYTDISRAAGAPVRIPADEFPVDEPQWDMLNITNCGVYGIDVDAKEQVLDLDIKEIFYNGGKNTCTNVYRIRGKVRKAAVRKVLEHTQLTAGLFGPSESLGVIESNQWGSPQGVEIGDSRANITACPGVILRDTTAGAAATKMRVRIGYQDCPNYTAGATIQASWCSSLVLREQRFDSDATGPILSLDSTVDYVQATNLDLSKITGTINRLKIGNTYYKRRSIADDAAAALELPALFTGAVTVITEGDSNACGMSLGRQGAALMPGFAGTSYNIATGALTGSSGTDGKLNVSLNGGSTCVLYVENRTGTPRNFLMMANGGNLT